MGHILFFQDGNLLGRFKAFAPGIEDRLRAWCISSATRVLTSRCNRRGFDAEQTLVRFADAIRNADLVVAPGGSWITDSFETSTRNTTDINAIPVLNHLTHLPVMIDPSHSTGHWELVGPVARAGIAAGADAVIAEVHPAPAEAL